jgi:hypothetical protein
MKFLAALPFSTLGTNVELVASTIGNKSKRCQRLGALIMRPFGSMAIFTGEIDN